MPFLELLSDSLLNSVATSFQGHQLKSFVRMFLDPTICGDPEADANLQALQEHPPVETSIEQVQRQTDICIFGKYRPLHACTDAYTHLCTHTYKYT